MRIFNAKTRPNPGPILPYGPHSSDYFTHKASYKFFVTPSKSNLRRSYSTVTILRRGEKKDTFRFITINPCLCQQRKKTTSVIFIKYKSEKYKSQVYYTVHQHTLKKNTLNIEKFNYNITKCIKYKLFREPFHGRNQSIHIQTQDFLSILIQQESCRGFKQSSIICNSEKLRSPDATDRC